MTLSSKFQAIDKQFEVFQNLIEDERQIAQRECPDLISEGHNDVLINTRKDLQKIRDFYSERFYSKHSISQSEVLDHYKKLYTIISQISQNTISLDSALKAIEANSKEWRDTLVYKTILSVCYSIAWLIPAIGGLAILPFVLPLMPLSAYMGVSILIAGTSSIILTLSKIVDNISSIESTTPVSQNTALESTFIKNIHRFYQPNFRANDDLGNNLEHREESTEQSELSL
ncbi:hypothetical protein ELY21_03690 [Legionella sp. km535]|uniref:DUF5638 domain-containing protein n=1 Tax=Legionella sp. km535 TaxID=2498107 RepID=UPI000F8DCD9A|nr:DUF5638 domain-containing protein [Legionella sp. km535]RUR19713.1 hypothetical protein ELY21_03690 [Legionella sp. km535]